jgi:hypothetical protein
MGECTKPPSEQIQDAIDAPLRAGQNLPIQGAWVTYVKPWDPANPAGFFLQADLRGPALFVEVDPASLSPAPAVGDEVELIVTEMASLNDLPRARALENWSRVSSNNPVRDLIQNLSWAKDVVTALDSYNSELISVTGTVYGEPVTSGEWHRSWGIETLGGLRDPRLKVRLPINISETLRPGCEVELTATPMWRFRDVAQFCAWDLHGDDDDNVAVNCP